MHYLLFYETSQDYITRRKEFRDEHLALAWKSVKKGELILGGAYNDPVDGALLLFKGNSPEVVYEFVKADPYIKNGLVTRWSVREWTTVVGEDAESPIKPG